MDIDHFWKLVYQAAAADDKHADLQKSLEGLSDPADILKFQEIFDQYFDDAYRWDLWGAAYMIAGGCSDDGFTDFRYGLISKGRSIFEKAIADADSIADFADPDLGDEQIEDELYGYIASRVYEERTSSEMPRSSIEGKSDPDGEQWDFEDEEECAKHLPRLTAKFF